MTDYKLYCFDPVNRMTEAKDIKARTDEDALDAVRSLAPPLPCELWHGDRLVKRIAAAGQPGNGS
jgi:hypothetical protein